MTAHHMELLKLVNSACHMLCNRWCSMLNLRKIWVKLACMILRLSTDGVYPLLAAGTGRGRSEASRLNLRPGVKMCSDCGKGFGNRAKVGNTAPRHYVELADGTRELCSGAVVRNGTSRNPAGGCPMSLVMVCAQSLAAAYVRDAS